MPTNSEKIDTLLQTVARTSATLDERTRRFEQDIDHLYAEVRHCKQLIDTLSAQNAALTTRCAALEKGTDRAWQFAPLVLSGIALLASLVVALIKK